MGFKELYGGSLFLRESNNTLIFVRSNYRVKLPTAEMVRSDDSWVLLDGWLDQLLRRRADCLMLDFKIRW